MRSSNQITIQLQARQSLLVVKIDDWLKNTEPGSAESTERLTKIHLLEGEIAALRWVLGLSSETTTGEVQQ